MSRRAARKDTQADIDVRDCTRAVPPIPFIMTAGAGSGKTTSLIKALSGLVESQGPALQKKRQQIACITYTEVAAGEIWADVNNSALVHVSTIHSFLWRVTRAFQTDIKAWVTSRIHEKIQELKDTAQKFGPRVQKRTREKNAKDLERYERLTTSVQSRVSFNYGMGSDFANGILGHDDVIRMATFLITDRPLLRAIIAQQFPFIFVDESQDTFEPVVSALKAIVRDQGGKCCLGFFGDPEQQIYLTGIGKIGTEAGWKNITKPENFRCPSAVLNVANAIRRDADGLVQTRGQMIEENGELKPVVGSARIVIATIGDDRDEKLAQVRAWAAVKNKDPLWVDDASGDSIKVLVIVHRMAAKRLGFGGLYAALNDKAPEAFKNGFLDGTAWPTRPFLKFILPIADAVRGKRDFQVMELLRAESGLLKKENLSGVDLPKRLAMLKEAVEQIEKAMAVDSTATVRQVLQFVRDTKLISLDPRLLSYLSLPEEKPVDESKEDDEELTQEIKSMDAFLACKANELWGYQSYIKELSPFSTQQGIKGTEFDRVLVILDDEEGTNNLFSYEKYFGIKPLSERDEQNIAEGKESTIDRTRRLFYVCCTRALKDLVVVLFTESVKPAELQLRKLKIFPDDAIIGYDSIKLR